MTRRTGALRERSRTRWAVGVAVSAVIAVTLPGFTSSTASWNDDEWTHADVGTSSFSCGADTDYTTRSTSRFLSGSLAGINLDDVATVEGVDVTKTGTTGATVDPVTAPQITSTDTTAAYGNPLDVKLLGDTLGLNLTGLGIGLPAGSTGAVNQVAKSSATGQSTAASGLVSDSGGLLVTDSTPTDQLPQPASLNIAQALPAITSITNVGLDVGAVGSTAQLDGCDLLEDQIWGTATNTATRSDGTAGPPMMLARTGTTTPHTTTATATATETATETVARAATGQRVARDYGVASLDLRVDSPLVGSLTKAVQGTVTTLDQTVVALAGTDGLLSRALQRNIVGSLTNGLGLGTVSGTVAIDGLNLSNALKPVLTAPLTDGVVTVDLTAGTVRVDLAHLLGDDASGLNDLPPNSEIVLDAALLNGIAARLGTLMDSWTQRVTTLLTTLLQDLTLRIALNVNLNLLGIPLLQLNIKLNSGIKALMNGQNTLTIGTTLLGANLGLLTGVVSALVAGLLNGLPAVILSTLTTTLFSVVNTLGSTLTQVIAPLLVAVESVLSFLPGLLSLTVNVHEDTAGQRTGANVRTGTYSVTALRIRLLSALTGGNLADVDLATATVGPSTTNLARPSTA